MIRAISFCVVVSYFLGASAAASDKWYGMVTLRYCQNEDISEVHEAEGSISTLEDHTRWDVTAVVRLTGGQKGTIYTRGQYRKSTASKTRVPDSCGPNLETVTESMSISTHSGSTNTTIPNSWVEVSFDEDGRYTIELSIDMVIPDATLKTQTHNSSRSACPGTKPLYNNSSAVLKLPLGGLTFLPEGKTDKPDADHLDGTFTKTQQTDHGSYTISATWNLTRDRMPRVQADPGGPYSVVRGARVRLDGSKSKGKIEQYVWSILAGEDCPEGFEPTALEGSVQDFPVLCSVRGFLIVKGDEESDRQPFFVDVTPRNWTTDFLRTGEHTFDEKITRQYLFLGKNRCAEDGGEPDHFIHRNPTSMSWEKEGYVLDQIDQGPFAGFWFVASEKLRIKRNTFINQRLLPGGEIYQLNASTNLADMNLLIRQVREHEKLHSDLAEERLRKGAPDFDPAIRIERMFKKDGEALKFDADFAIRDAETEIEEASSEQKVKDRMKGMEDFKRRGKLIVPDPITGGTTPYPITSFAGLGDYVQSLH